MDIPVWVLFLFILIPAMGWHVRRYRECQKEKKIQKTLDEFIKL